MSNRTGTIWVEVRWRRPWLAWLAALLWVCGRRRAAMAVLGITVRMPGKGGGARSAHPPQAGAAEGSEHGR